jgi:hypothetical protein
MVAGGSAAHRSLFRSPSCSVADAVNDAEEFRATILARQREAEGAMVHGDPRPRSDFRFDVEVVKVSGGMAYTLGFERFNGRSQAVPSSRSLFA